MVRIKENLGAYFTSLVKIAPVIPDTFPEGVSFHDYVSKNGAYLFARHSEWFNSPLKIWFSPEENLPVTVSRYGDVWMLGFMDAKSAWEAFQLTDRPEIEWITFEEWLQYQTMTNDQMKLAIVDYFRSGKETQYEAIPPNNPAFVHSTNFPQVNRYNCLIYKLAVGASKEQQINLQAVVDDYINMAPYIIDLGRRMVLVYYQGRLVGGTTEEERRVMVKRLQAVNGGQEVVFESPLELVKLMQIRGVGA